MEFAILCAGVALLVLLGWTYCAGARSRSVITETQREEWEEHIAFHSDLVANLKGLSQRELVSAPAQELAQLEESLSAAIDISEGDGPELLEYATAEEKRLIAGLRRQRARVRVARQLQSAKAKGM